MDVKRRRSKTPEKLKERQESSSSFSLTTIPVYLLSKGLNLLKPFAPQLIPLLVFSFFIPLILTISAGAGYAVWKNVATGWEVPLYLQYGDGSAPYAVARLPSLATQQPYDISLHLNVPITESNVALGNFMTSLRLASTSNQTVASVRRPGIVIPSASLLFSGPRTTRLNILLLPLYKPTTSNLDATISLGRQDNWNTIGSGEGRELAVFDASLRGVVVHTGFRGIATRFPLLSSVAASALFLVVLLSIMTLCMLPVVLPENQTKSIESDAEEESSKVKQEGEEVQKTRRISRASRSSSSRRSVKRESDEFVMPERESTSAPLRRRRSRLFERVSDPDG